MRHSLPLMLALSLLTSLGCNLSDDLVAENNTTADAGDVSSDSGDARADSSPTNPCDALMCVNGTCVAAGDSAACECEDGWAGELCDRCDDGLQDNDDDGVCRESCATSDVDCGEAVCDDSGGTAECSCPTGLTFLEDGICSTDGVLGGPNLAESASRWTTFGDGSIDPDYTAADGTPGAFVTPPGSTCESGGTGLEQTITLGPKDEVGELIFEIDFALGVGECDDFGCDTPSRIFVKIGDAVYGISPYAGPGSTTFSTCLPETAYDAGEVEVRIWAQIPEDWSCPSQGSRDTALLEAIENVRVRRPTGEETCATGQLPDGTFESGTVESQPDGWDVRTSGAASATVEESAGNKFLELRVPEGCSGTNITHTTVVPATADPANGMSLRFSQTVSPAEAELGVRVGAVRATIRSGDASPDVKMCLPHHQIGTEVPIWFGLGGTGFCADVLDYVATVDNIRFEEDPNCPNGSGVADGTFDGPIPGAWTSRASSANDVVGRAIVDKDEELGNPYAELSLDGACAGATIKQVVSPNPANGNAVKFRYRFLTSGEVDTQGSFSVRAEVDNSTLQHSSAEFAPTLNWTFETFCLPTDPYLPRTVEIGISPTAIQCATTFDREFLLVDDVELIEDPACP